MPCPSEVIELVRRFEDNIEAYKSGVYNETQIRLEFIDPFFKALGWDVHNEQGYAENYKDVIHEDAIKIGGFTKAPDYCFRIGGVRKFFLEAKKPSVNLRQDINPAYQLKRYAWSAKLPLSILTDFEELAVYDCRIRPLPNDKASTGRILYIDYKEYAKRWVEIAGVFAKDAVLKGSFDKYALESKGKRGTAEVDSAFLNEIESWRNILARNIAIRNSNLSQRELNFAVQTTIDRIIFLRICEDRGVEQYGSLMALQNGNGTYSKLLELFRKADERYNSGIFHFSTEAGRPEAPDELTPKLKIDDKSLKEILKRLYFPQSPYEFSVLPAEILGQVYEQFLGKVIRLTKGHQAVVEDKPEVKKAGGVYYTPSYIVDYIVKNTVGKLVEGKTPNKVSKLKILDPACGSGSFLIGAYKYLIDWHRNYYVDNGVAKHKKVLYQAQGGEWRLTTAEKKRILLNNIYGVDIDSQAVEVTKLSLLLKVLEGESDETINTTMKLFHERVLPDLGNNIKCGNSLIGPDYYANQQMTFLDEEERNRVNAFDWKAEFSDIMSNGGLDTVIGNPPYIRIQTLKEWAPTEVEYYKQAHKSASKGNYDIYVVFVEQGLSLLNKNGKLGFILPHKFFNAKYGEPLRELIAKGNHLNQVVHFGHNQIFSGATTYTNLLFLNGRSMESFRLLKVDDLLKWQTEGFAIEGEISNKNVTSNEWNFVVGRGARLFERLNNFPLKLGDISNIFVGLQTSADDVYILDFISENSSLLTLKSVALNKNVEIEKEVLHPLVSGTDVCRYSALPSRQYIIFPYEVNNQPVSLIDFNKLSKLYPKAAEYLLANKKRLEDREKGRLKGKNWHGYIYHKNMLKQSLKKICIPRLVEELYAAYDVDGSHYLDNVDVGGISLIQEYEEQGLEYLLGLLNSRLLRWHFPFISAPFRGGWLSANRQFVSQLPMKAINFSNPAEKAMHDQMVNLVDNMLELHKRLAAAKTPTDKTAIQRQITATDNQIDQLVYKLYGLTEKEIKIVEGSTKQ